MNEPSNFCEWPCLNPAAETNVTKELMNLQPQKRSVALGRYEAALKEQERRADIIAPRQEVGTKKGLPGRNLTLPAYQIHNSFGALSNKTADTDLIHRGGWAEYDTHNL
jgi:alpha-glucosidase